MVRIPPEDFGRPLKEVAYRELRERYEGYVNEELGYVIAVVDLDVDPIGRIIPGDGAAYHRVAFSALVFYPELQEVVEGEVVEVTDFGVFLRVGPIDALLHVSQLMDDFITFDERQGILIGKETGRSVRKGDLMRVRIVAVSFPKGKSSGKIGVTARQPFLGKLEWIEEDVRRSKG